MVPRRATLERFARSLSPSCVSPVVWTDARASRKERGMKTSFTRLAKAVLVTTVLTLSMAIPVAAREPVDPNTLNPPPPAEFNPTCERVGGGIICDLAFSDPPLFDEPGGVVCDGTEIVFSQTRSVVGKRIYDSRRQPVEAPLSRGSRRNLHEPVDGSDRRLGDQRDEHRGPLRSRRSRERRLGRIGPGDPRVRTRWRDDPGSCRTTGVRCIDGGSSCRTVRIRSTTTSSGAIWTHCSRSATLWPDRALGRRSVARSPADRRP